MTLPAAGLTARAGELLLCREGAGETALFSENGAEVMAAEVRPKP